MIPTHWPKWALFFVALALMLAVIAVGLILEPIGLALAPTVTPKPTLPAINYARPQSKACEQCHMDRQALTDSGASVEEIEALYIESASLETVHGSLGCITCHGGTGDTPDKEAAHQGLIKDLSETHPEDCLLCHRNLPDRLPEDNLNTPHGAIVDAVWEGSECGVLCSDCHGEVGHGFDPVTGENICAMSVCVDCHKEQKLGDQLTQCDACHEGPHDVSSEEILCKECHPSTDAWEETAFEAHSPELTGQHTELDCFLCHRWPNFTEEEYVCSACHKRPHELGAGDCALCHTTEGWDVSAELVIGQAMSFPHPTEGTDGIEDCLECHGLTQNRAMPADHDGRTNDDCQVCHTANPALVIPHPVEEPDLCWRCHAEGEVAQYPYSSHKNYDYSLCLACHAPSGAEPTFVSHTVEGREDCMMCHGPVRVAPYPASHAGRDNEMCLLCHETDGMPTDTIHLFPQNHEGAAENCVLCHPGLKFETYSCEECHAQPSMKQIHEALSITFDQDCMECHEDGTSKVP